MQVRSTLYTILAISFCLAAILPASNNTQFHQGNMRQAFYPKYNYDSLFVSATSLSESAEGQALIENCIKAYGGVEHLGKITSYQSKWRMATLMSSDSTTVIRTWGGPRKYKIEKRRKNRPEMRVLIGDIAWYANLDTVMQLGYSRYNAEYFGSIVLAMPLALKNESFNEIRYGTRPDDSLGYLYLKKRDSVLVVVGIDRETHMIRKAEGVIASAGMILTFANLFDKFEKVDGYIFPHRLTNVAMGTMVGESYLLSVKINPEIPDDFYAPIRYRNLNDTF